MSRTAAKRHPFFSFQNLEVTEQVRRALPIARQLIRDGIKSDPNPHESLSARVLQLVKGSNTSPILERIDREGTEEEQAAFEEGLAAARAIGMALGIMLHGDTYLGDVKDGAR